MYVFILRNPGRRLKIALLIIILAAGLLLWAKEIATDSVFSSITVSKFISFSYPVNFKIEHIYVNESRDSLIEATSIYNKKKEEFKDFSSLKGRISFKYPSIFKLDEKYFGESELLYHIDFLEPERNIHGFVEVWDLPADLDTFLSQSKKFSNQSYKNFSEKKIDLNRYKGHLWDYSVLSGDKNYIKSMEVFLENNSKMYRLSYFLPESQWDEDQSQLFWKIANSLKIHDE